MKSSARIVLFAVLIPFVALCILAAFTYSSMRSAVIQAYERELQLQVDRVRDALGNDSPAIPVLPVGKNGYTAVIRDGLWLSHPDSERIGAGVSSTQWYTGLPSGVGVTWLTMDSHTFFSGYSNVDGLTVLGLLPQAEYKAAMSDVSTKLLMVLGGLTILLVGCSIFWVRRLVVLPIREISSSMQEVSSGSFHTLSTDEPRSYEFQELENAILETRTNVSTYIHDINQALSSFSKDRYDMAVTADFGGDFAPMKEKLNAITVRINELMGDIRTSAYQVSSGAEQISQGAQILATGSTQQAVSVEEFSQAVAELQEQSAKNTVIADQVCQKAESAGGLMMESIGFMKQLSESMQEIEESANNIAKVMKVIDDIAYQTNILALNAAVEAARAGHHGKGFAVVADEVRNLATKSAEAARDTAELIESSVRRIQQGSELSQRTDESMHAVAELASSSAADMRVLADVSKLQSEAITEMNQRIEEISSVVQANSATAQQSAASAEEMAAQSNVLNQIVSRFRLREEGLAPTPDRHKPIPQTGMALGDNPKY